MKVLTIVVHSEAKQQLLDVLRDAKEISGFTFSHAEGHGAHLENDKFLAARDQLVGHSARLRVDLLLNESACRHVIESVKNAGGLMKGHSVYWVSKVEESNHF